LGRQEKEVVEKALRQVEDRRQRRRGVEAMRWLAIWWVLLLVAFFVAPWPLGEKLWAAAHGVCAQPAGHMLTFGGQELPLCARDSGLYLGALMATVYLLARRRWLAAGRPPRWFWVVSAAVVFFFLADVANSVADDWFFGAVYRPHNALRLTTGLLMGTITAVLVLWAINVSFTERKLDRPILPHWGDLVGLLFTAGLSGLALWSGWPALFLILTVLSMGGMVGMLLLANALGFLTLTRGRGLLGNAWESIPLLFWGGVAAVVEIAALSWLRYRLGL
jgi:uncharacterized membrane protein